MKTLILATFLISSSAFAATVKVTSFAYVRIGNTTNPLAELCGKVEGADKSPTFIKVLVDPGSKDPASYNTLADDKGNFCLPVLTYRGTADVSIIGEASSLKVEIQ